MNTVKSLHAGDDVLRVVAERFAETFAQVVREMPVEQAIAALCPSHQSASRDSRRAA